MATACLPLLCLPVFQLAQTAPDAATPQQVRAAEIYQALEQETSFEFVDKPLMEALSELAHQHNFNLVFSERGLHAAGVDKAEPVNLILNGVKLKSALRIILDGLDLDDTVHSEVMVVSSAADAKSSSTLHSYDISSLLNDGEIDALVAAIREQISDTEGQTARVSGYRNVLLVTGNRYVQENVQRTLTVLAQALSNSSAQGKDLNSPPTY
jgi:hypothetical protein